MRRRRSRRGCARARPALPRRRLDAGDGGGRAQAAPQVAATTLFRAIYYARERRAFFDRAAGYTQRKLVFDLNPRQYRLDDVLADLCAVGLTAISLRPFFVPQTVSLPGPAVSFAKALERTGPLARLALRVRFTYIVAASR
jgi:hypothetical protein